jgi:hypothetical protein
MISVEEDYLPVHRPTARSESYDDLAFAMLMQTAGNIVDGRS